MQPSRDHVLHLSHVDSFYLAPIRLKSFRLRGLHHLATPHFWSISLSHLSLGQDVEHFRVVPRVHGALHTVQAPHPQSGQRAQDPRHHVPPNLQTLDDLPMTDIPAQHNNQILLELLRMPRHLHARSHVASPLSTLRPTEAVVLQNQAPIRVDALHRRGIQQEPLLVHAKALQLLLRRIPRPSLRAVVLARPTSRIHAIANAILFHAQHTHSRHKTNHVLRKRYRIALENP